ncbi:response regulator transcription factor [Paenibacillus elgii]|uniref:response regulator transcription factor n=1 Tax=Paenibacillus elgii TaxID=189691 RepID=UPI000248D873|nr:response regulator transcription factor [Paenibacillus elgii]
MRSRILIVDDEDDIISLLKDHFEYNGYHVLTAENGKEAIKKAEQQPDIILLDINMPELDGFQVCDRIRNFVSCPIIFLTARIEDADKILGFGLGADDYVVKPFSLDELSARVAAHIRRDQRGLIKTKAKFEDDLTIDYAAKEVYFKNTPVVLAKKEFEIIELLSLNSRQIFDKERIYEQLWGYNSEGDASVIAEHIRKIRAKLVAAGAQSHIETVWGCGYKWVK